MTDKLQLLNTRLAREIIAMSDDELWQFLLSRMDEIEEKRLAHTGSTYLYYCLITGVDYMKQRYYEDVEYDFGRNELNYSFILDFCFEGERLKLGYYATGGFYDNGASCDARKSAEIMPPLEEDSDFHHEIKFYILEANHLAHIIEAMEKHVEKLTVNTPEDIETIKQMRAKCLADDAYKAGYIYYED
jgi:hypothetical protein